ncbi:conserved domain protein [Actinomyces sp. oral taxon 175 str. F0384]|nr:conserved domain protein [Actinomyces sp. oral taxon 175 str. F0384]
MMAMRTVRSADLHGVSPESSGSIGSGGVLPDSVIAEDGAARDGGRTLRHVSRTRMLILPAVLVLGLGLAACGGGKSQSTASPSASTAASASGSASAQAVPSNVATPTVQTAKPTAAPASPSEDVSTPDASSLDPKAVETGDLSKDEYPEVGLDKSVRVDGDLVISLGQMQAKDFASGPGEVGGAGVLVPVTVTNKSSQDLPLASVLSTTVNYGEGAGTPASEIVSASDAVPATLAAGQTVTVNRAFVIPAEGRGNVKVVVDLGAGRGAATFRGSAG